MKKHLKNAAVYGIFTVTYAVIIGLGLACLLEVLVAAMCFEGEIIHDHPRFIPFCLLVGFLALIAFIGLIVLNIHVLRKLGYTKWWIQSIAVLIQVVVALVLSVPVMTLWLLFFRFLQATF